MILGLLNVAFGGDTQRRIQHALQQSGLLEATDRIYYSRAPVAHRHVIPALSDGDLFTKAIRSDAEYVWSLDTTKLAAVSPDVFQDWLSYQLFFLVEHWARARARLEEGYDAYGVNLRYAPEPHYEGYCFWMRRSAMAAPSLSKPFCAFQSMVNHHLDRFPRVHYEDCDWGHAAPFSASAVRQRVAPLLAQHPFFTMLVLRLVSARLHFDSQPSRHSERPRLFTDLATTEAGALAVLGVGRLDVRGVYDKQSFLPFHATLPFRHPNLNVAVEVEPGRWADVIYTTPERAGERATLLRQSGVMIVNGPWRPMVVGGKDGPGSVHDTLVVSEHELDGQQYTLVVRKELALTLQ